MKTLRTKQLIESLLKEEAYSKQEIANFNKFVAELEKLSMKYGVAVKSVGGVDIGEFKSVRYSRDYTSGDLIPRIVWK